MKGLGEIVVDAVGKSLDPVIGLPFGGKDQDGKPFVLQADVAQNGETVQAGQHDVQDDQVRIPLLPHPESLGAAAGDGRLIALQGEIQLQPFGDVRVILDDEDSLLFSLSSCSFSFRRLPREGQRKDGSPSLAFAVGDDFPAMKSGDLLDEIEADAASPDGDAIIAPALIELSEYLFTFFLHDADPVVPEADQQGIGLSCAKVMSTRGFVGCVVFDGIGQDVHEEHLEEGDDDGVDDGPVRGVLHADFAVGEEMAVAAR